MRSLNSHRTVVDVRLEKLDHAALGYIYINPLFRICDFMVGMAVGTVYLRMMKKADSGKQERSGAKYTALFFAAVAASAAVLIISCFYSPKNPWLFTVAWTPLSAMVVFCASKEEFFPKIINKLCFENKALAALGGISLELFLIHQLVIRYWVSTGLLVNYPWLSLIICFIASIVCAVVWKKATSGILWRNKKTV